MVDSRFIALSLLCLKQQHLLLDRHESVSRLLGNVTDVDDDRVPVLVAEHAHLDPGVCTA